MFEVTMGRPRWSVGPLAWVMRVLGIDRRWVARGSTVAELDADLRRLAIRLGLSVEATGIGSWTLGGAIVVSIECPP